jgi:pilus assembly protein TadC
VAKKKVEWFTLGKFIRRILTIIIGVAGSYLLAELVFAKGYLASWVSWLIYAVVFAVALLVIVSIYVLIFERKEAKSVFAYVKAMMRKKKKVVE